MARKLSDPEKLSIVTGIGAGMTNSEIARNCHTTRQAVGRIRQTLRNTPHSSSQDFDALAARNRIVRKSYIGLEAALDDGTDPYKRGALAVQALKGTGEFQADATATVNVMFANVPAALQDEYRELGATPLLESGK